MVVDWNLNRRIQRRDDQLVEICPGAFVASLARSAEHGVDSLQGRTAFDWREFQRLARYLDVFPAEIPFEFFDFERTLYFLS